MDHLELIEPFTFHTDVSQAWASSIRHNNYIQFDDPIYMVFKQTCRVNNVSKHVIVSSHYMRIFSRADENEPEAILSLYEIKLLEQCHTGTIEILHDTDRYLISAGENNIMLYAMIYHNIEVSSKIKHKFGWENFSRGHIEYNDNFLWMEALETGIYLFNSPESTSPRNFISYKNVISIEKSASLKGIFENVNKTKKSHFHTISEGKFKPELLVKDDYPMVSTYIVQVRYPFYSFYLKFETTESSLQILLSSMKKSFLEYKSHISNNKNLDKNFPEDIPISARSRSSSVVFRNSKFIIYPSSYVETDVGGKKDNEDTFCNLDVFCRVNDAKYSYYGKIFFFLLLLF